MTMTMAIIDFLKMSEFDEVADLAPICCDLHLPIASCVFQCWVCQVSGSHEEFRDAGMTALSVKTHQSM